MLACMHGLAACMHGLAACTGSCTAAHGITASGVTGAAVQNPLNPPSLNPPLPHTHAHTNTTQDRGIGRDLALLYEAYATFLELKGTFPRADLVYQEGINRCVDPLHLRCAASLPCVLLQHLQGKLRAYPALAARASCAEC